MQGPKNWGLCVCVCVCVTEAGICIYMYIRVHVCPHMYIHVYCMIACIHVHTLCYINLHVFSFTSLMLTYILTCTNMCIHVRNYTLTYVRAICASPTVGILCRFSEHYIFGDSTKFNIKQAKMNSTHTQKLYSDWLVNLLKSFSTTIPKLSPVLTPHHPHIRVRTLERYSLHTVLGGLCASWAAAACENHQ